MLVKVAAVQFNIGTEDLIFLARVIAKARNMFFFLPVWSSQNFSNFSKDQLNILSSILVPY